jgi:hypothetical protein
MSAPRPRIDLQSMFRLTELADYIVPFTLRVISNLKLADQLREGPRPVEHLAAAVGAHAPSLYRALRALTGKGIFAETEPGVFGLTPLAELLRTDHPLSLADAFPLLPGEVQAWARFEHSVRTGEPAFAHVHGQTLWEYLASHPDQNERFDRSQEAMTRLELRAALRAYDWSALHRIVDVGGGNGAFLSGVLAHHKAMRGVLLDLPHVVARAGEVFERAGVADRCEIVAGSFLDEIPPAADAYVIKRVLWGCADEQALRLLRNIRGAMNVDSRLLILEPAIQAGGGMEVGSLLDLRLLALGGGHARTDEQVEALLRVAGLNLFCRLSLQLTSLVDARLA